MTVLSPIDAANLPTQRAPSRAWRKLKANKGALAGCVIIVFFTLLAVFAPLLPIPDPNATDWSAIRKAPSMLHWFGTDDIGRDNLSRMIWGARASLHGRRHFGGDRSRHRRPIRAASPAISAAGSIWSSPASTDAFLAMPFLITAIALAAFLGPSLTNAMIAIGLSAMPIFVRLTRGQVLAVKTEDYVEGARSIGLRHLSIITALHPAQCRWRRSSCRRH